MRIGLLTGEYPPMEGGVGAFTQELAKALAVEGADIFIISHRQSRPAGLNLKAGQLNDPIDLGYAKLLATCRKWGMKDMAMVAEMVDRYEIDLVNIQYQPAAYNMRSAAINILPWRLTGLAKAVVTFHDLRTPFLFPKAGALREKAVRFMAGNADGVIATNQADYQKLLPTIGDKVHNVPIGSNIVVHDVSAETIKATRSSLGLSDGDVLLAYFGFLNESKGADTLIAALALMSAHHHLVFIGGQTGASDPDNNENFLVTIREQIAAAGLDKRVHWTGFVGDAEVSAFLNSAELVVLPYRDGVSLRRGTLMAALAHGCAIVTTPPVIADDGLDSTHFEFIESGNVDALARTVGQLVADTERIISLGANARRLSGKFSWSGIAARTLEIYSQLLD